MMLQRGVVTIKNRVTVQCSCEETIGDLVKKVTMEFKEELRLKRIVISANQNFIDAHEVVIEAPISICRLFNCKHCCIYFKSVASLSRSVVQVPKKDAFLLLIENARKLHLPSKLVPPQGK